MSGSFAGFEGPGSGFGAFGGPGFGGPGFGGPGLGPGGPAGFGLRIKRAVTGSLLLDGPASAAQIVQRVSDATEGEILLPEPVVERVLERLAHKGVVTTEDGVATLTDFGRKVLAKRASPARRHRRSAPRSSQARQRSQAPLGTGGDRRPGAGYRRHRHRRAEGKTGRGQRHPVGHGQRRQTVATERRRLSAAPDRPCGPPPAARAIHRLP